MSVHYKFKNTINYDAVKFDGVHISVNDLKNIIFQQKKLGDSDLQIENEETGQVYADDQEIPKNTNLLVVRVPFANPHKRARLASNQSYNTSGTAANNTNNNNNRYSSSSNRHNSHNNNNNSSNSSSSLNQPSNYSKEALELVTKSNKPMSEEEKLKQIQSQSAKDFDPSKYARGGYRGPANRSSLNNTSGNNNNNANRNFSRPNHVPGPNYTCRKCGIPGHLIQDCKSSSTNRVKPASGIPKAFMRQADAKDKGALRTASGEYAVPYIDDEAYKNPKIEKAPFFEDEGQDGVDSAIDQLSNSTIPEYLKCGICRDLLVDAVMSICCKKYFCDNCIRTSLIESEMHECPSCLKQNVSPDSLVPSKFFRVAVSNFDKDSKKNDNTTGESDLDLFLKQIESRQK